MHSLDAVVVLLLLGGVCVGSRRGFGRSLFDACALLVAVRLTPSVATGLRAWPGLETATAAPAGFLIVAAASLFLAKVAYDATQWTASGADRILGGSLGAVAAGCVAYVTLLTMVLGGDADAKRSSEIDASPLAHEMITFERCRKLIGAVDRLGA